MVESTVQEQAILNGDEIVRATAEFVGKLTKLIDSSAESEPDLLRSDDLFTKLADLFQGSTGQPYPADRQKDIYTQGSQRYAQAMPPGYKDDKKGEPTKYGDLLIWFQLLDQAKAKEKPIIFVTGDVKEDWLQQHRGDAIGPRPELRQEMMAKAGVPFWLYTTPRFLEFAKQFLGLKFDTKKAESEFEKIEKQDKKASEQQTFAPFVPYDYSDDPSGSNQPWFTWRTENFLGQPAGMGFNTAMYQYPTWIPPADSAAKQRVFELLPIQGAIYSTSKGKWKCEITGWPESDIADPTFYSLKFEHEDHSRPSRNLKLWVSLLGLKKDVDWRYKKAISDAITRWLGSNQLAGEIKL